MTAATYVLVDAHNPHWQKEVVKLAHSQIPFIIAGTNSLMDKLFGDSLKITYNLEAVVEEDGTRFTPKAGPSSATLLSVTPWPVVVPSQSRADKH